MAPSVPDQKGSLVQSKWWSVVLTPWSFTASYLGSVSCSKHCSCESTLSLLCLQVADYKAPTWLKEKALYFFSTYANSLCRCFVTF